jgi:prepilin-type N-terminal cleavage/methylation domain-containing protein
MKHPIHQSGARGFTLVELIITSAVIALVFGGLMASVRSALILISNSKATTSAISLANEQLEYIRSLTYDAIGTTAGIPNGAIPQNATTSLNGIVFHERVLIEYVDSVDDGVGAADTNGILADYKRVKVEYSWATISGTSTIFLVTNVVPPGIESTVGGGTLTVNVFDKEVLPVAGAEVRIYNDTTTTTIDTMRFTNASGTAMFAGAPAAANYQITVTKAGYSTDQTYTASTSNPSPITPHVAVLAGAVSTMNFQIDQLSDLRVRTVEPSTDASFTDTFTDLSKIATVMDVEINTDVLQLVQSAGLYVPLGTAVSASTSPSTITAWDSVFWDATVPLNTALKIRVYSVTGTSTYALVPESDLPGNSEGFTAGSINITNLDVGTYPSLGLAAEFLSSSTSATPQLDEWHINYVVTEPSIASVPFTLTSTKIIGSTPVYKYQENHTTDGGGAVDIQDLEWDFYNLDVTGGVYNIEEACPALPYTLDPGENDTLTLTLVPATAYSLRVSVVDTSGNPILGADITLSRSGFSDTIESTTCGQVFFNTGLGAHADYDVDVSASGYTSQTITGVNIDGTNTLAIVMVSA